MNILVLLIIGVLTGISIGVTGIGAGIIMMPLLIHLGVPIKTAVSTSIFLQIVPQTLPAAWLYYKNGHFDFNIILFVMLGSIFGVSIGSYLVNYNYINEKHMYLSLFILLIMSTIYIGINNIF
tara:strand:- start:8171 stop:8539 length:369 start_codon:yes stop_codon:yes gene_type:complete